MQGFCQCTVRQKISLILGTASPTEERIVANRVLPRVHFQRRFRPYRQVVTAIKDSPFRECTVRLSEHSGFPWQALLFSGTHQYK